MLVDVEAGDTSEQMKYLLFRKDHKGLASAYKYYLNSLCNS